MVVCPSSPQHPAPGQPAKILNAYLYQSWRKVALFQLISSWIFLRTLFSTFFLMHILYFYICPFFEFNVKHAHNKRTLFAF